MKTVIIVQARMTSTRLPGKILMEVLGRPLLDYQIERLRSVKLAQELVIATTVNQSDDPVVSLCEKVGVKCFRGSEQDVLARYYQAAAEVGADAVVRVTSDCPLIDPGVIDQVIERYWEGHPDWLYVSNVGEGARTYPRGMDTEVFSFSALSEAFHEAVLSGDREHVTPFIRRDTNRYPSCNLVFREDASHHRWTVDTPEDFQLIRTIIEAVYPINPRFSLEDCLELLARNPEWSLINDHIRQKEC